MPSRERVYMKPQRRLKYSFVGDVRTFQIYLLTMLSLEANDAHVRQADELIVIA